MTQVLLTVSVGLGFGVYLVSEVPGPTVWHANTTFLTSSWHQGVILSSRNLSRAHLVVVVKGCLQRADCKYQDKNDTRN